MGSPFQGHLPAGGQPVSLSQLSEYCSPRPPGLSSAAPVLAPLHVGGRPRIWLRFQSLSHVTLHSSKTQSGHFCWAQHLFLSQSQWFLSLQERAWGSRGLGKSRPGVCLLWKSGDLLGEALETPASFLGLREQGGPGPALGEQLSGPGPWQPGRRGLGEADSRSRACVSSLQRALHQGP